MASYCLLSLYQVFSESISSVVGGVVGSTDSEVVVATYSGRVMGLVKELIEGQSISQEVQSKLTSLRYTVCESQWL